jgi:hypothetical protein
MVQLNPPTSRHFYEEFYAFAFHWSLLLHVAQALEVRAGIAYSDPTGGWIYIYNGDQLMVSDDASGFASLDGTWSHNNGSDTWDGSTIGGTFSTGSGLGVDNGQSGANLFTENGIGYLRIQDTGDPRDYGYPDPSNRKVYFGHDVEADGGGASVIDTGITLTFRARIPTPSNTTFPLDPLHRDGHNRQRVFSPIRRPATEISPATAARETLWFTSDQAAPSLFL